MVYQFTFVADLFTSSRVPIHVGNFLPRSKQLTTVTSHCFKWSQQNNLDNKCDPVMCFWLTKAKGPRSRAFTNAKCIFDELVISSQGVLHFAFAVVVVACFVFFFDLKYVVLLSHQLYCHQFSRVERKYSLAPKIPWSRILLFHIDFLSKYSVVRIITTVTC